jgi:REP element-mobilizing transposase RayT
MTQSRKTFSCLEDDVFLSLLRALRSACVFDICAYAVMSNHYHVVLHVDQSRAKNWTQEEVVERWLQLYQGSLSTVKNGLI